MERYGAQNVSEVVSADGTTELVHSCLLDRVEPHHSNGDAHPSAWVNVEKGLYCCSVYWSGSVFSLIQKLEGKESLGDTIPVISEMLSGATKDTDSFRQEMEAMMAQPLHSIDIPSYSERVLDPWRISHPYMREWRGVSHETQEVLGIGYDERENRIVFPHWFNSSLVGWQKRAIPERRWNHEIQGYELAPWLHTIPDWPKYRSSSGFPKSETLYGYDMALDGWDNETAVVVESPMSVAKAHTLRAHPHVVATFGAKVSKTQIGLLRKYRRVYVWFDDDPAGHNGERKLVDGLWRHTEVLVVPPDFNTDLGDLASADEVHQKLDSAVPAAIWLAARDQEDSDG